MKVRPESLDLKMATLWLFRISSGSLFHRSGPEQAKARSPKVLKFVLGMLRRPWSQERRWRPEMESGCRYSWMHCLPWLSRDLKSKSDNLKWTWYVMGSQWKWDKAEILKINRVAALSTFWRRSVWYLREENYSSSNVKSQMREQESSWTQDQGIS